MSPVDTSRAATIAFLVMLWLTAVDAWASPSKIRVLLESRPLAPEVDLLGFRAPSHSPCWQSGVMWPTEAALIGCMNNALPPNAWCSVGHYEASSEWTVETTFMTYTTLEKKNYKIVGRDTPRDNPDPEPDDCIPNEPFSQIPIYRYHDVDCSIYPGYSQNNPQPFCKNNTTRNIFASPPSCAVAGDGGDPVAGNPCDTSTGDKTETEVDYQSPTLSFSRTYHSFLHVDNSRIGAGWSHQYSGRLLIAGDKPRVWVQPNGYIEPFSEISTGVFVSVTGSGHQVRKSGLDWVLYKPSGDREIFADSTGILKKLISANGEVTSLNYNSDDMLAEIVGPFGHKLTITYDAIKEYIEKVTDPMGRDIVYNYDANTGNLERVTYQDGKFRDYLYTKPGLPHHLTGIKDENGIQYANFDYDSKGRVTLSQHIGGIGAITLVYDEGASKTTVTDAAMNNTVYEFTPKPNQWKWEFESIEYDTLQAAVAAARADDPDTTWNLAPRGGIPQYLPPTSGGEEYRKLLNAALAGEGPVYAYTADYARRTDSVTDERGNRTKYGYDTYHRTTVTEADQDATGLYKRTTTTDYWEDTSDLPVLVTAPSVTGGGNLKAVTTDYVPGTRLVQSVTVSGYDPAQPSTLLERTTTFASYDADGLAGTFDDYQPGTINGPRTDVSDITVLDYWEDSSPGVACTTTMGGACGQLKSITNAAGHPPTTFDAYYPDGRLQQMTDPNGLVTTYTYDLRGRLDTVTETPPTGLPRLTDYDYDDAGQLDKVTLPNGQYLDYEWTDAHLLDYVTDNLGHRIDYSYDLRGNRTGEDLKDNSGALKKSLAMVYDARNRLDTLQEGLRPAADISFDATGLLEDETDSAGRFTDYEYDPLNRLLKAIDPVNGAGAPSEYGYNVHDDLTSVETPNGATTTYVYDDLGNLRKEVSPDRGTTLYGYDDAGNMTCKVDGRYSASHTTCSPGAYKAVYAYDALNRLVSINYTGTGISPDIIFQWDSRSGSADQYGRLRQIVYTQPGASGNTVVTRNMDYDAWGNVVWSEQTVAGNGSTKTMTTEYEYDGNNQITEITYPSGRVVNYTRGANGRITGITASFQQGNPETVVSGVQYYPFGPVLVFKYGNDLYHQSNFDSAYGPDVLSLYSFPPYQYLDRKDYTVDDAGNIESIADLITAADSRSYGYDDLNRLSWDSAVSTASPSYSYDGNGNRLTRTADVGSLDNQVFTYQAGSNRIDTYQRGAGSAIGVQHDGMGNVSNDGQGRGYEYGQDGRMNLLFWTPANTGLTLEYNALGELARSRKVTYDPCTSNEILLSWEFFSFAPDGRALQIISENNSRTETDIVWLDGQPVAQFLDSYDSEGTYQGTTMTYLHGDHLGAPRVGTDENQQISWRWQSEAFGSTGPTGSASVRLRLPGQVHLGLANVHYNYYRDYFPQWGRYLESDPIGLDGGLNTYGYVDQNPLRWDDPEGLDAVGNLRPRLPKKQDRVCTFPMDALNFSPCAKQCCLAHDLCYAEFGCNETSWWYFGSRYAATKPCQVCNTLAAYCVVSSLTTGLWGYDFCNDSGDCIGTKAAGRWIATARRISRRR